MSLLTIIFDLVKVSALPQVVVRSQSLLYPNQPGRQIVLRSVTGTIYVTLPLSRGICQKKTDHVLPLINVIYQVVCSPFRGYLLYGI